MPSCLWQEKSPLTTDAPTSHNHYFSFLMVNLTSNIAETFLDNAAYTEKGIDM